MAKFGKWIGLGLGWALLGPIGGIIGLAVGSVFDSGKSCSRKYNETYSNKKNKWCDMCCV